MAVQLGINPLTWTNDDLPTLGADTPLETCLTEGRQAGFTGFELGNKFPRQANILGPILAAHDLVLVSGWYSGELLTRSVAEEIKVVESHLTLLRELGANVMVFAEVTNCIHGDQSKPAHLRPQFPANRWQEYGEKLTEFARYTQKQGVQIAYHHHMGTVIETEEDVDHLMENTGDEVGLLLDTGHLTFAGADPLAVAERWAKRINHVHCKDIRPDVLDDIKNRKTSFLDAVLSGVFTVPGDGCVDYPAIFQVLKKQNYEGWLVVEAEQDPAIAHPFTYATMGYNNLRKFARDAGLF
ncbi:myo-inosose-2 dehydratase [Photorhabdus laumondii subsp. laumondii]|uniref:Myo-inosose-2 dehydratase n=1 Tax=Photorhabdus laumondii subsp. laumondii TaxID=141679 RepID=A0A6L9JEN4_PHOLM|nr:MULTISPECIES: myo-inosose-2 dehydratase [Photorhabdus]AXG42462.1 myo-inosose-2 dehydratase [Photorhabdus laumondii subsp. laumondii]MCC8384405.1 myo-inosose-2 dehydratase [Photorhabdus laumondii]MCC8388646.1 myo-inosose-2 dehydratase [Photorhabdus laumondii]MCC8413106.1 myo-inosose-2 dehydratase [Photorhabdus laumondii]MCZ1248130.1 myo-inosose-2 dehydratase [Photorhabdus laumondii subsp. laumondii]